MLQIVDALACPMLVKLATAKLTRRLHAAQDLLFQVSACRWADIGLWMHSSIAHLSRGLR